jgi:hypothetical protein
MIKIFNHTLLHPLIPLPMKISGDKKVVVIVLLPFLFGFIVMTLQVIFQRSGTSITPFSLLLLVSHAGLYTKKLTSISYQLQTLHLLLKC